MRADARRNRDTIVETARALFRAKGYEGASMDEIAKAAGVGPGTLYRHFPTKDALIDAVMQAWLDKVETATDKTLAFEGSPRDLLLLWLQTYVGLISYNKGTPAKLTAALDDPRSELRHKCQALRSANRRVLDRLEGQLRSDLDPTQVIRMAGGIATVADQSELDLAAVNPMLEVIADGLLAEGAESTAP